MTREKVTLVREVTGCNYDGTFSGRRTETVEAVIEWPGDRPHDSASGHQDFTDWRISRRIDPKPEENTTPAEAKEKTR